MFITKHKISVFKLNPIKNSLYLSECLCKSFWGEPHNIFQDQQTAPAVVHIILSVGSGTQWFKDPARDEIIDESKV